MSKYIWDIEANGFQDVADTIWMSIFKDVDTGQVFVFTDYNDDYPNLEDSFKLMDEAEEIIAHNGLRYDAVVLEKVTGYKIPKGKLTDTIVYSRLNDFHRRAAGRRHNLKALAKQAGEEQKLDYSGDFDNYSDEMLEYCIADVEANYSVYKMLMAEYDKIKQTNHKYDDAINIEHEVAYWSAKQVANGWEINEPLLNSTLKEIKEKMNAIENRVEPKLGTMEIIIDKEPKTPKYKKDGTYTAATARILGEYLGRYIDPTDSLSDNPPVEPGDYQIKNQ